MKHKMFLFAVLLLISTYSLFGQKPMEEDPYLLWQTTDPLGYSGFVIHPKDSINSITASSDNGLNFLVGGGVGMTNGSSFGWWSEDFKNGPIVSLGLEIPFTKSHIWAFEIYSHTWFCQIKRDIGIKAKDYNKITNSTYSQSGVSAIFKLYLFNANTPFRVSLNLGSLLFPPFKLKNNHYHGIEMGLGLYYKIKDNLTLNLTGTTIIGEFDVGGGDRERTPNYVLLKCYYRTNWSF